MRHWRRWRITRRIRERIRRKRHAEAIALARDTGNTFVAAVDLIFGSTRTVSVRAYKAVRSGAYNAGELQGVYWYPLVIAAGITVASCVDLVLRAEGLYSPVWDWVKPAWDHVYEMFSQTLQVMGSPWFYGFSVFVIVALLLDFFSDRWMKTLTSRKFRPLLGVNRVPFCCAMVVIYCAVAQGAPYRVRKGVLRKVDLATSLLIRSLLRASADRTLLPFGSARRKEVGKHCALVAGALRDATLELDRHPVDAPKKIADLALKICHRYVDHRWGALLDASQLNGVEPIRNREPLRLGIAVAVTISVAVAAALIGVPAGVQSLVIGGVALMVFSSLLGGGDRSLALLDSLRGIQRP
ncbi:hypothetical protein ACFVNB_34900 [Streptomyces rochei]|uniref:hypothetical protein n=1 Tax=Streptomyces rochei TaxID=1928 RepID=UPI003688CE04